MLAPKSAKGKERTSAETGLSDALGRLKAFPKINEATDQAASGIYLISVITGLSFALTRMTSVLDSLSVAFLPK